MDRYLFLTGLAIAGISIPWPFSAAALGQEVIGPDEQIVIEASDPRTTVATDFELRGGALLMKSRNRQSFFDLTGDIRLNGDGNEIGGRWGYDQNDIVVIEMLGQISGGNGITFTGDPMVDRRSTLIRLKEANSYPYKVESGQPAVRSPGAMVRRRRVTGAVCCYSTPPAVTQSVLRFSTPHRCRICLL
jgi:hypothetical protein